MQNSVPKRVYDFIVDGAGNGLCDDCIREDLRLTNRHQVTQVTSSFGVTPLFERYRDNCSGCGKDKLIIVNRQTK